MDGDISTVNPLSHSPNNADVSASSSSTANNLSSEPANSSSSPDLVDQLLLSDLYMQTNLGALDVSSTSRANKGVQKHFVANDLGPLQGDPGSSSDLPNTVDGENTREAGNLHSSAQNSPHLKGTGPETPEQNGSGTPQTTSYTLLDALTMTRDDAQPGPSNVSATEPHDTIHRDIVLPRWQPDAEATYCPICHTQFSFFVRKHHCRKCGRVVCNSCSPHRITIPYQFIVQPIAVTSIPSSSNSTNEIYAQNTEMDTHDRYGGMKVRLCNPCVPDPNTNPPQQPPTYYMASGNRDFAFGEDTMNHLERTSNTHVRDSAARARGVSVESGLNPILGREQQTSSSQVTGRYDSAQFVTSQSSGSQSRYLSQTASHVARPSSHVGSSPSTSRGHTRANQSLSFIPAGSRLSPQPNNLAARPPRAAPRISEEDECPICHGELPSRTLANFEEERAAHITRCIEEQIAVHNGQSRPGAFTSQSQPTLTPTISRTDTSEPQNVPLPDSSIPPGRSQSSVGHSGPPVAVTIANTPEARTAAREAAHAAVVFGLSQPQGPSLDVRRTGMFLYKASEKDCVDDAECTICLEEFEVGTGMARLECLCRFHSKCIREWFVEHPGRCPVHQHDGFGF